jgi:hypothetical protein
LVGYALKVGRPVFGDPLVKSINFLFLLLVA